MALLRISALLLLLTINVSALSVNVPVSVLRERVEAVRKSEELKLDDTDTARLYPSHTLRVPIDHFHNDSKYVPHSDGTFKLRYYFDATYYKPGGPVIMLLGGETGVDSRLPYLQKGIVHQLAVATNGLGVILEHRYYGKSFPTRDLSTENLRFLTTEQAMADTAYFAQHVDFPGLDCNVKAPDTPWIVYGGSYAGAFAAFLRVIYPDVFFGAISSSGVTEAIYDYWAYFDRVIELGPQACIETTQDFVYTIDKIIIGGTASAIRRFRAAFGLKLEYYGDIMNTLAYGVNAFQAQNWDPNVSDNTFSEYCGNVTSDSILYDSTIKFIPAVKDMYYDAYEPPPSNRTITRMLNYIGYIRTNLVENCKSYEDQHRCFSLLNRTFYAQDDKSQWPWRSWAYQYCDQWGYLLTGSGVPLDVKPLISRTINLWYTSFICRAAFGIDRPADVDAINKYGGYGLSYDKLAFIDGQMDPWREATPHARVAPERNSTIDQPFILIEGGVHHWDENGLFPNETTPELPPRPVKNAQRDEVTFVQAWLAEWNQWKLLHS